MSGASNAFGHVEIASGREVGRPGWEFFVSFQDEEGCDLIMWSGPSYTQAKVEACDLAEGAPVLNHVLPVIGGI